MIGKLRGKIDEIRKGYAIIDVGGVGYRVYGTEITLGSIAKKEEVGMFIHTDVKEDHIRLFGFEAMEEFDMFELLISISGVGPKAALGILTIANPPTIKNAIIQEDSSILTRVSGIGKKTAERIILELSNKVDEISVTQQEEVRTDQDVVEALISMGYSVSEARQANKDIPKDVTDISEKIKYALKKLKK
jgi:holliday junction DNA helicase RuvA